MGSGAQRRGGKKGGRGGPPAGPARERVYAARGDTATNRVIPSRKIFISTGFLLALASLSLATASLASLTCSRPTCCRTSPAFRPCSSAGLPGSTAAISAPLTDSFRPSCWRVSGDSGAREQPNEPGEDFSGIFCSPALACL